MRITRLTVATACLALAISLAACSAGGSGGTTSAKPPAAASSATTAQPTHTPTTQPKPAVAGIVLSECLRATNEEELDFVDPASAQVTTRYFPFDGYGTQAVCNTTYRWVQRSAYNGTFTLLAANLPVGNDGYHAGVLHAAKGMQDMTPHFTDLSAVTGDNFGAAPQQTAGAFGPDGNLYFVQITPGGGSNPGSTQLMMVDPTGGKPHAVPASNDVNSVGVNNGTAMPVNAGVYFVPGYGTPLFTYNAPLTVAPDGSWAFWYDSSTDSIRDGVPGTSGAKLDADSATPRINPMVYVDKASYIGIGLDSTSLVKVTVNGSGTTNMPLLPATDGDIGYPTLSPDHTKVAFILTKDTTRALYTVPVAGGTPTKVEDLYPQMTDQVILDWTAR